MTDKAGRAEGPAAEDDRDWAALAMTMAPAAGCECQMLGVSIAGSLRAARPADVLASTAPRRKH